MTPQDMVLAVLEGYSPADVVDALLEDKVPGPGKTPPSLYKAAKKYAKAVSHYRGGIDRGDYRAHDQGLKKYSKWESILDALGMDVGPSDVTRGSERARMAALVSRHLGRRKK